MASQKLGSDRPAGAGNGTGAVTTVRSTVRVVRFTIVRCRCPERNDAFAPFATQPPTGALAAATTLTHGREIALANGVRHADTGNVHDVANQSTRCRGCGALLIERDWYELGE